MSEVEKQDAGSNPFDPETFAHGGGLWDGKTVTITGAVAKVEALTYKDGSPVWETDRHGKLIEPKRQSTQTGLTLSGVADGGDDKERRETYSSGDKVVPTPDGFGFVDKETGGVPKFHANSNIAKLATALNGSGFDVSTLWDVAARKQRFDRLVGARFVFKGEAKLGRDGKPIKDKKGYDKNTFLPVKFVGYVAGTGAAASTGPAAAVPGNGGVTPLESKATEKVLGVLAKGPLSRADLVRTLAQTLAGDPDSNGIIGLVVQDGFHKGKPWKYDGMQASL